MVRAPPPTAKVDDRTPGEARRVEHTALQPVQVVRIDLVREAVDQSQAQLQAICASARKPVELETWHAAVHSLAVLAVFGSVGSVVRNRRSRAMCAWYTM